MKPVPITMPGPLRPEVPALAAAVAAPLEGFGSDGSVGRVVVLDHGLASDLLDLVADLCPDHQACEACGEQLLCEACGIGVVEDWCHHKGLCPDCRFPGCGECRTEVL